jgi:hypothetical protein
MLNWVQRYEFLLIHQALHTNNRHITKKVRLMLGFVDEMHYVCFTKSIIMRNYETKLCCN